MRQGMMLDAMKPTVMMRAVMMRAVMMRAVMMRAVMMRAVMMSATLGLLLSAAPALAAGGKPKPSSSDGKTAGKAAARAAAKATGGLDRTKLPEPGPTPKLALPTPRRFTMPSGARLLVVERHTLPMVAVAVVWPHGAMFDPAGHEGLASLTASLLDEGTAGRGSLALATTLQGLGSTIESGAGWDTTAVSMVTLRKNLDTSMSLLAEVALQPAFAPAEFERVKAEQIAAVQQRKDSAQAVATERLLDAVFGPGQRLGVPASGTEASLARIRRDDVVRFHQGLRLDECVVIVAGDVEAETMRALAERHFGAAKLRPAGAPAQVAQGGPLPAPRRVVVDKPGAPQSELRLGLPGPPRSSPDWLALTVMNEILGGGDFSNRLNLNLREAHAFAYGASSMFGFHKSGGAFLAATATKTAVTGPALREVLGELDRIRGEAVLPGELRFAKDAQQRGMARRFETLQDVVFELAQAEVFGLPEDFFATFSAKIEAVTDGDVLRVARQYLDPARLAIVIVGDAAVIGPQLGALGAGAPGHMAAGVFEGLPATTTSAPPKAPTTGAPPPIPTPPAR